MGSFWRRWPWFLAALAPPSLWAMGQVSRRMYGPHYPDVALHAGLALVAQRRRVLAVAAHPGDLEVHAAGTLFLLAKAGSAITTAVLSAGEASGKQRNLAKIRGREQEQAAAVLGYDRLVQMDLPDGGLTEHPQVAAALRKVWEETQPELVLAPDPRGWRLLPSPDLAATGYAAVRAALGGAVPGTGPGPAAPELPDAPAALGRASLLVARERMAAEPRLLLYGTRQPNVLVDITEVLQEKVNAVRSHRTQLRGPDWWAGPAIRRFNRRFSGDTSAYYVEGFYRLL